MLAGSVQDPLTRSRRPRSLRVMMRSVILERNDTIFAGGDDGPRRDRGMGCVERGSCTDPVLRKVMMAHVGIGGWVAWRGGLAPILWGIFSSHCITFVGLVIVF